MVGRKRKKPSRLHIYVLTSPNEDHGINYDVCIGGEQFGGTTSQGIQYNNQEGPKAICSIGRIHSASLCCVDEDKVLSQMFI